MLRVMSEAITAHGGTEVHRKLVKLPLTPGASPPGFTSCCLINESHVTAHSYSDIGWLAVDVFTCGSTDPRKLAAHIRREVEGYCPNAKCVQIKSLLRFPKNAE